MINKILEAMSRKRRILILTHNNPDPDAMSAAFGLQGIIHEKLKKKATIAYMGVVGRIENRELVKRCHIDMHDSLSLNFKRYDFIIVVDTQPQAGNVYIPNGISVNAVVDHHESSKPLHNEDRMILDIRPEYGSSSSIIAEYYKKLEITPSTNIATALSLGITTDVIGSARDSHIVDRQMLGFVFPYVSLSKIAKIQNAELPRYHFKTLHRAIENSRIVDRLLISDLGEVRNSDLIAETADYMSRMRDIRYIFVVGIVNNVVYFSIRHKTKRRYLSRVATGMVRGIGYGGGHKKSAGGQVPLVNNPNMTYDDVVALLKYRVKRSLSIKSIDEKPI